MSLLAWYPLTSNMNNQGIGDADLTVSTTPTFVPGLIGGALQGGGSATWTATQTAKILNNTAMSFAFWVYVDAETGDKTARNRFFGNDSPRHYSIFQYPTCNDLHWDWRNNAGNTVLGNVLSGVLPSYKWTHVTFTYQNPSFKVYINGVQKHSASGNIDVQDYANATTVILQCAGRKLCDYRVYNHCLSALEVKQISQALILHYPMTGGGRGQDNLYDFESVARKWKTGSEELIFVDATDDVYGNVLKIIVDSVRIYRGVKNVWKADTNFTVSFLAKASKTAVLKIERSRIDYAPDVTVGTTWKRYSTVISCTATTTGGGLGITSDTAGADIYLTQIKVELGDKATAYCPGVGDSHYNSMGYNDNTEYDVSGYLHNGAINGSVSYSSDTPRYSVSTVFANANSNYISLGSKTFDMTSVTFSAWFKVKTAQTWSRIFDFGASEGAGYCIGLATGSNGTTLTVWGRLGSVSSYLPDKQIQTISLNTWYHAVITISGTTCSCYVNGQLVVSFSINSAFPSATTFNYIYFGKSVFSADKYLDGNISDFRMYATALSAEDIQKLYNTAVSLSNNGTLMGYELIEN